ncbi:MAG: restriction endonuclease subunit S domain-containing protein [Syntrophales bacterium]
MVKAAQRIRPHEIPQRREGLSTTIYLGEVLNAGMRLEASTFNIEARRAVARLKASGLPLMPLYGPDGLCREAHNAFRFKRIYVRPEFGVPFLSSSDIIGMRPEMDRYLSKTRTKRLEELLIRKWDVLITCSGTIGNVSLASDTFAGMALSQDAIRLRADDPDTAGFVTAFLRSRYGRLQLVQATYGSVVQHIEPEHLTRMLIPDLPAIQRIGIGRPVKKAYELRDEANLLLDEADKRLHERLRLPRLATLIPHTQGPICSIVRTSQLALRFEASFHDPLAMAAERLINTLGIETTTLGSNRVTAEIRPITKFRKRVYVPQGGIPLLSSKQLFQIDPIDVKGLAKGAHTKDLKEIALEENMIVVSRSGTIGKVGMIPGYMNGWAGSEHATRIIAADAMNPGYLYAWLASDYGTILIKRHSYGSVILEIDKEMLGSVLIPFPETAIIDEIGDLVLKANGLRDDAWRLEREAIRQIEELVDRTEKSVVVDPSIAIISTEDKIVPPLAAEKPSEYHK